MSEKKLLTQENINNIFEIDKSDEESGITISVSSMDELIEQIRHDAQAKSGLRKFIAKETTFINGVVLHFSDVEERLAYLKEHYYIEGEDPDGNAGADTEAPAEPVVYETDFERLAAEMEESGYRSIIAEQEENLSSMEVNLTENSVIENEVLRITWRGSEPLDMSRIFIMESSGNRVFALGHMFRTEDKANKFWCVFDDRNMIRYERFEGQSQVRLVIYTQNGVPHSCIAEMNYKKMGVETEKPLCIDFGTSNTTAGSYGIKTADEVEIVKFADVTVEPHNTGAVMLPTIIYVEDCSDPENIKYIFGYEAMKRIEQEEHYEFKASAFFEIKRWMTSPDKYETINDNNDNKATIERKKIIKAYIDYVIEKSEQYFEKRFEKLHFSAPVKLKSSFIGTFRELYRGEKEVLDESESIDEAFAIVYNQIISIIYHEKKSIENKNVLIMDCGGGTTDLANCSFTYTRREGNSDELRYTTRFENGNPNFGGNNITYRVMQLLKIKIAAGFDDTIKKDAMLLIDKTEDQILSIVETGDKNETYNSDECNKEIYQKFVDEYNRCEAIIPTKFTRELNLDGYEAKCRKRNFYCMWRLAEKIKIEFFNSIKVQFDFCDRDIKELLVDSTNDYFYVISGGELKKEKNPLKNVTITNKDVERIICGDIYGLLYGLMKNGDLSDDDNKDRKVENFDYYKLSGQSCKIPMFKELLKEYIPGRKLRPYARKENHTDNSSETLKLECLEGCIRYIKDLRGHELSIVRGTESPKIIYNIFIKNDYGEDTKLFDCNSLKPENTIFEVFHYSAKEMFFSVKNKDGEKEKEFSINLDDDCASEWNPADKLLDDILKQTAYERSSLEKVIGAMTDKLDSMNESAKVMFCLPAPDHYGAKIFLVGYDKRDGRNLYKFIGDTGIAFESPDKTFFDGRR